MKKEFVYEPFDECDWGGFAGAEEFANGDSPVAGLCLDDDALCAVIDAHQVGLYREGEQVWIFEHQYLTVADAIAAFTLLDEKDFL